MGKKSDAREARKALAQEKFEAGKAALLAKVTIDQHPRQIVTPSLDSAPRVAPHLVREAEKAAQTPKTIVDGSRFGSRVAWCITKADQQDGWSWGELRKWSQEDWDTIIYPAFEQFERITWQEVDQFSSDTGHKMHHGHEVGDLIDEAQDRWRQLNLEEYDSVFRFRLGGQKRRAWGFIVQDHFHFVWWDREHKIYPTEPS